MPLIRIDVCDFKSYRGQQTIGPFKNFTSVIGPNGAGKSNLMDAISFVLGVKSNQLRSSQLKDLVYRGRKLGDSEGSMAVDDEEEEDEGEGTAKKAWVLAVYVDAKKKEWNFKRSVTVTGASEYQINGKVVTFSAYNAALVDHNILIKAKNFLVFQGDVEAVASQSPKALTRLIERISGSLELEAEYEKAREEQEKATENATTTFTKRRGMQGEIKQYKEQKSEAERFENLLAERDDLVLHRILFKLFHIEESIDRNVVEIKNKSKDIDGLQAEQERHDEALERVRASQARSRNSVMQMEKKIKKADKSLEAKRPDLAAVEATIHHSQRKLDNAQKNEGDVVKSRDEVKQRLQTTQTELESVERIAAEAQAAQRRTAQINSALSDESLEEYRRLRAQANVRAVSERQELEGVSREEKTQGRTLAMLKEKEHGLQEKLATRTEDLNAQKKKKRELDVKVSGLHAELTNAKQELDNQRSERTRIQQLEAQANEKLQELFEKLVQAGVDKHESEREVKMKEVITNLQRIFPGVHGRVIDLCKPTQRKYETAVSVVLGRNTEAIVVDLERTAIDCIEYLKTNRAGTATFIPLDGIQLKPINDKYRSFAKGARLAVDVIQYEATVERAIHHACGNALVCDTMEVARHVCYDKKQDVKAVTLEGTIIHKSGLITGGRSTHSNIKSFSDADVQGLQRQRDQLISQLKELKTQRPRDPTDEKLVAEITRLEGAYNAARDEKNACNLKVTGLADEVKHLEAEIKQSKPQLTSTQEKLDSLSSRREGLERVIHADEDIVFTDFCESLGIENVRIYEERQLKVVQAESETRLRYETQITRLSNQCEYNREALKSAEERLESLSKTVEKETANVKRQELKKEELKTEIAEAEHALADLRTQLKALKDAFDEKSKEVDEVRRTTQKAAKGLEAALKEISNRNDDIEKLTLERDSMYRKCRLEEIKLPLLEGSLRNFPMEEGAKKDENAMDVDGDDEEPKEKPNRREDYGIEVDFESLEEDEREEGDPTDAVAQMDAAISKLNTEIERIAPNMKANDRLNDVQTKLHETEEEVDQARKESQSARNRFEDVKRRRCDLFNEAYNYISEKIDPVYKDLTKGKAAPMGGVAYLASEDTEEPYLAGIKYHAMPPMKRFRDMEQLSGGEKTVAALALLFAIHSYRPAPFFVLDEVDAALDNTNVAKIANYIRSRASNEFQFIVISLKGSLYEKGDSLVGIYRDQEVNSSKTLTLDLTQYDD